MESLLALSQEYQILKIKDQCEIYLLQKLPSIEGLLLSERYDLRLLKSKCLKYFGEKALWNHYDQPQFQEVTEKSRLCILQRQLSALQSHCKTVYNASVGNDVSKMSSCIYILCKHKPKNVLSSDYYCHSCRASIMKRFLKQEASKLGMYSDTS